MKVILLSTIRGVGQKGQLKDVHDGYARNFLVPRGLATIATQAAQASVVADASRRDRTHAAALAAANIEAAQLKELTLRFIRRANEQGETFGSVSGTDVTTALRAAGIKHGEAVLEHPLKRLGVHSVPVKFIDGTSVTVTVTIEPEEY